ncbi:oligosaccharide flippase family protein [bacterium]|nr:oligosaccharide flippase family protein [bacterium]
MFTKKIFQNVSLYFFASLIKAAISLAINPIIALNMSHYDYALTGFYTSFNSLFMPFLTFMFGQYYSRNYFRLKSSKDRDKLGGNLVSAQLVFGMVELVIVLIAFSLYSYSNDIKFPLLPYSVISFTTIVFNYVYTFFLLKLKLSRNAKSFFMYSLYHVIILVIMNIIFVVLLKTGGLGKLLAPFVTSLIFAVILFPKISKGINLEKKITIDALKFCWPLIIAGALSYFFSGFDRSLLAKLDNDYQLGLYNVAMTITGFLVIVQTSILSTFQPDIFKAVAENNKKKIILVLTGINLLNTVPILIFIILAPYLLDIFTGGKFTEAYRFARILALKNITAGMYYSISGLVIAYGFTKWTLVYKIIGSILSIFLFKYLVNSYAFYGAAWGQVFSYLSLAIIAASIMMFNKKNLHKKV